MGAYFHALMYLVKLHPEAKREFDALDGRQKALVVKKIEKLAKNPYSGVELGNKAGYNLTGYRKMYVDKKRLRIVYAVYATEVLIEVISIGKREHLLVYENAFSRQH